MMHGEVVRIRLNPQDVMGCIDLVEKSGISTQNMSLAMVARLALSACLDGLRQHGTIPTRDGFEYSDMINRYTRNAPALKLATTSAIIDKEVAASINGMSTAPFAQDFSPNAAVGPKPDIKALAESIKGRYTRAYGDTPAPAPMSERELRNAKARLAELSVKELAGDDWNEEDIAERDALMQKIHGGNHA